MGICIHMPVRDYDLVTIAANSKRNLAHLGYEPQKNAMARARLAKSR
ncbi:hypothetical protein WSK_3706 [Novosphingobium sp. Rr 2-17]|nr:hypothetical protein WSK_3706 [Novosphingobium sp. Rr 2-17]